MRLKYNTKVHGYWLDGKRCKSPSAIAKVPDDTDALTGWKLRQVALGIASDPDKFLTEVSAHSNDKEALDGICQQAIDASGGGSGRDRGSALHLITEKLDAGVEMFDTPLVAETRRVWNQLLDTYGLKVVHSEGVIVHPELKIAGRFDRIVTDGTNHYVLDIKGGADADKYVHAHTVQLALYANAPFMAELPVGDTDFEVTEFSPMPDVSREVGLIAHIPIEGEAKIIAIDVAAGWSCFNEVIKPIWGWRARRDLVSEFTPNAPTTPTTEVDASLLERIAAIQATDAGSAMLRNRWPAGVAGPKAHAEWTPEQATEVLAVVVTVERDLSLPFLPEPVPPVPMHPDIVTINNPAPPAERAPLDEGPDEPEMAAALIERLAKLRAIGGEPWVLANAIASQANEAGTPISITQHHSRRRCEIVRFVLAAVDDGETTLRNFLAMHLGDDAVQPGFTTGAVIGSLSISEAQRLADTASAL